MSPTYSVCREHGYISGEHYTCPKCGSNTEVYSRITGYYRPVQNWNDGKIQEWNERKEYDLSTSKLKKCLFKQEEQQVVSEEKDVNSGKNLLFIGKECPNCKMAEFVLNKGHIDFVPIVAEEHKDLAVKYGRFTYSYTDCRSRQHLRRLRKRFQRQEVCGTLQDVTR